MCERANYGDLMHAGIERTRKKCQKHVTKRSLALFFYLNLMNTMYKCQFCFAQSVPGSMHIMYYVLWQFSEDGY